MLPVYWHNTRFRTQRWRRGFMVFCNTKSDQTLLAPPQSPRRWLSKLLVHRSCLWSHVPVPEAGSICTKNAPLFLSFMLTFAPLCVAKPNVIFPFSFQKLADCLMLRLKSFQHFPSTQLLALCVHTTTFRTYLQEKIEIAGIWRCVPIKVFILQLRWIMSCSTRLQ